MFLKMVTTRAMSRRSHKGESVPSLHSRPNGRDQTLARVEVEAELRVEAALFLPSPAPSFSSSALESDILEKVPNAPVFEPDPGPMSSETIPRPRSLGGDPRLRVAMAKVLARIDGVSTPSAGIFKARPHP